MHQNRNESVLLIFLILITIAAIGTMSYKKLIDKNQKTIEVKTESEEKTKRVDKTDFRNNNQKEDEIFVHLGGEVIEPGVYQCKKGSRVYDILKKAGGVTKEADLNKINLVDIIKDGEKIIIPSLIKKKVSSKKGKININRAEQKELEQISGIGPVTAKKIIEFRKKNGSFEKVNSLEKVSGIGPKTIEKIKEEITY